jgi:uncharacterized UPF0160 family protein
VKPRRPLLVTHSGSFHLDDAFAYVVLRLALDLHDAPSGDTLVRTRDEAVIAVGDIVWDVGTTYNPATSRFDHHQRGAPRREDGLPYSAAGLVWRHYGEAAVRAMLDADAADLSSAIAAEVEREVVRCIDAIDNGVGPPGGALSLSAIVEDFNPAWDAPEVGNGAAEDAAFLRAAEVVEAFLRRRISTVRARLAADDVVLTAHGRSADPRILELHRKLPWEQQVFVRGLPVLYAIYPVPDGNWMVDTMPIEPGCFEQRLPLPTAWAGLRDAVLAAACGVPEAVLSTRGASSAQPVRGRAQWR